MENIENLKFYALLFLFAIIVIVFLAVLISVNEKNAFLKARVAILKSGNILLDNLLFSLYELRTRPGLEDYGQAKIKLKKYFQENIFDLHSFTSLASLIRELPASLSSDELKDIFYKTCREKKGRFWAEIYLSATANDYLDAKVDLQLLFEKFEREEEKEVYRAISCLLKNNFYERSYPKTYCKTLGGANNRIKEEIDFIANLL